MSRCTQGSGASPEGNKPFIDLLDADSGETQRIWQSKPPFYESTGASASVSCILLGIMRMVLHVCFRHVKSCLPTTHRAGV